MVLKSLKTLKEGEPFELLSLYKDEEDEATFVKDLLLKTILHDQLHQDLVTDLAKNWEADRIAKMDMLMIKMGLTELMYFNSIPTKVTINEYIEISKYYSTPKSNIFINGILDKAVEKLTAEKKIVKIGRGLIN
jgi:N utilization substance protein B